MSTKRSRKVKKERRTGKHYSQLDCKALHTLLLSEDWTSAQVEVGMKKLLCTDPSSVHGSFSNFSNKRKAAVVTQKSGVVTFRLLEDKCSIKIHQSADALDKSVHSESVCG
ncbi:hypothetical protein F2P81_023429 [Scophthalmus maximus]|uniref:Uncharacterized protein n=1 Tax=Scophthalmus maximus TaxID=52904 RepID=A0A6A4RW60_SCOMX|nr:hypothetical protein F2P81_023429 [Scophthalmus maximus]